MQAGKEVVDIHLDSLLQLEATLRHLLSVIVKCLSLDSTDPNHICASFLALTDTPTK